MDKTDEEVSGRIDRNRLKSLTKFESIVGKVLADRRSKVFEKRDFKVEIKVEIKIETFQRRIANSPARDTLTGCETSLRWTGEISEH